MLLKFQLLRLFYKSECCREKTDGFLDSRFDGDNFEQKSAATVGWLVVLGLTAL